MSVTTPTQSASAAARVTGNAPESRTARTNSAEELAAGSMRRSGAKPALLLWWSMQKPMRFCAWPRMPSGMREKSPQSTTTMLSLSRGA